MRKRSKTKRSNRSSKPSSRQSALSTEWGAPSDLPTNKLPKYQHVAQLYLKLVNSERNAKTIPQKIAELITEKWMVANPNIPIISEDSIRVKVSRFITVIKVSGHTKKVKLSTLNYYIAMRDKLFDICKCRCDLPLLNCNDRQIRCARNPCKVKHYHCFCPKGDKVPRIEIEFIRDQRSEKPKLFIAGVDNIDKDAVTVVKRQRRATALNISRSRHKSDEMENIFVSFDLLTGLDAAADQQQVSDSPPTKLCKVTDVITEDDEIEDASKDEGQGFRENIDFNVSDVVCAADLNSQSESKESAEDDGVYEPEDSEDDDCESKGINLQKLAHFALEGIRLQIPDPACAALANALLCDLGIITESDTRSVIDTNKVRRWKKKVANHLEKERQKDVLGAKCIGVDGKKDKNALIMVSSEGQEGEFFISKETATLDHHTFTINSGPRAGEYLTHIRSDASTGKEMAAATYNVLKEFESVDTIEAILIDNTASNTGWSNGMIINLEKLLDRKVHPCGCGLHFNELPWRFMFKHFDGPSSSGNTFIGPVGQKLNKDLRELPIQKFQPIACSLPEMPEDVVNDLSQDQLLLRRFMEAVDKGEVDVRLASRVIGPLCHARWLTHAVRVLSYYCRTVDPSDELRMLVDFIQTIYGKYWFTYKSCQSWIHGPEILFNMIQDIKDLSLRWPQFNIFDDSMVKTTLQRNAFCCTGENFLASLVFSSEKEYRRLGVDAVRKIRSKGVQEVKPMKLQPLNFEATSWVKLIDLEEVISTAHSPPCLRAYSDTMLDDQLEYPFCFEDTIPISFPIHSQSVERSVKLTTEFSKRCYKLEDQRKYIISTTKSRKLRKRIKSKQDYKKNDFGFSF